VSLYPKIQQTTRKFKIRIITLKRKIQNYLCVLILFIYMIFWILITLNSIVLFPNVESKTCKTCQILIKYAKFTSTLTNNLL
jgi:hypothetical protein